MKEIWILILICFLGMIGGWYLRILYVKGIKIHYGMCPQCQGFGWKNQYILEQKHGVKIDTVSQVKCKNCKDGTIAYRPFIKELKNLVNLE